MKMKKNGVYLIEAFIFILIHSTRGELGPEKLLLETNDQNAFEFINQIIESELDDCTLITIHYDSDDSREVISTIQSLYVPLIAIDIKTGINNLKEFKDKVLSAEPAKCFNLLILYTKAMKPALLKENELYWGENEKILFVDLDQEELLSQNEFFLNDNFRFSNNLVFAEQPRPLTWNLYTLILFQGNHRQTTELKKSWRHPYGFSNDEKLFAVDKLSQFNGYDFAVAALPYSPFVISKNLSTDGKGRYRGMEVDLLDAIAVGANFQYHYVAPKDGQWGKKLDNGEWTGMIGMVGREEANWAISDITFSLSRLAYVDFSSTFLYDASELITPRALPLPMWQGPTRPFTGTVWITSIVVVLFSAFFISILSRYAFLKNEKCDLRTFSRALLFCLHAVIMKGGQEKTGKMPVRAFIGVWLLCAMNISIYYSSSLTSFLILPGLTKPIENFEELVDSNIGWAKVDFGGIQNMYLQTTTDPTLQKLNEGVKWTKSLDKILADVVKGNIATWENAITTRMKVALQYSDEFGQPLVHFTGTPLLLERIAWPLQKHAPYKKSLDVQIQRIIETGHLSKFYTNVIFQETVSANKKKKQKNSGNVQHSQGSDITVQLTTNHLQGPFYLYVIGFLIGFFIFFIEVLCGKLIGWKIKPNPWHKINKH